MNNRIQRTIGLGMIAISGAALAMSLPTMISRIRAHTAAVEIPLWQGETFRQTRFEHKGKAFALTTEDLPADDPRPGAEVVVRWGDDEARLLTQGLDDPRLPGLLRHRNWLQIIAFPRAEDAVTPEEAYDAATGRVSDTDAWKIVVVARRPTTVRDPDEWKAVRAKDWKQWSYTFLELGDAGIIRSDAIYSELDEAGWRHFAAAIVTPGVFKDASSTMSVMNYPNYKGVHGVIDQMGWTWAAVGVEAMVFVIGGLLVLLSLGSKEHVEKVIAAHDRTHASNSPFPASHRN